MPIGLWAVFLLLNVQEVQADGFRNPFQSGSANAQGGAFSAQADDASAIYYNPAGMTQLSGLQYLVGLEFVSARVNFTNPSGATSHNDPGRPFGWPPPGKSS
jgi:long-chain fatty acid transport protein